MKQFNEQTTVLIHNNSIMRTKHRHEQTTTTELEGS